MKTTEQIAAALQGYDPQALRVQDVNAFLAQLAEPVADAETVGVFEALGRVLAQDIVSPISVPPHDNSAMDGFAFRGSELRTNAPTRFEVVGTALAGKAWQGSVSAGQCLKIMTGAIMPAGLDTVAAQELVKVDGKAIEVAPGLLKTGDNRRFMGEDLMQGRPALHQGQILTPAGLGLVASLGLSQVSVVRRVKVAYFSTGDEILSLGEAPREGAVYDSNRYTVFGLLTRLGCEVIDLGVVRDQPELLEAAFTQAATQADAIITSGGVSVGEADFTKAMMKKLGDVAFWKIAMRPGRPMAVGRLFKAKLADNRRNFYADSYQNDGNFSNKNSADPLLFGLPGNPVAVMVTFLAFVRPALLRLMGAREQASVYLRARTSVALRKKPGRTEYQRGLVTRAGDGSLSVSPIGNQGSGVLSSMVQGNGLIVLHHEQGNVLAGDEVDVMMFEGIT
jgi:molybdopterin molybdotransferase